ncbi:hypothetical protein CHS0354_035351 [Potamilus streckersoni]|uniref:Replicative DNA helicase n=1 Tax=Potamilus streckersoni TaxID=2493646 RepID=A0AAE0S2Y0_9BIVA|nr:hypothetical protein CHS0354_035351 [Potamilus streckersoni]
MAAKKQQTDTILPHDTEAEKSILGVLIRYPEHIREASGTLAAEYFYMPGHRHIFQTLMEMSSESKPIDEVTLTAALTDKGLLEETGGHIYIYDLYEMWSMRSNIVEYCQIVKEHHLSRQLIYIAADISRKSRTPGNDIGSLIAEFQIRLSDLSVQRETAHYTAVKDILQERMKALEALTEKPGEIRGIGSGFIELDKITSGMQRGDLIILAARPSMGKTAFAVNIAAHAAINLKKNVLLFSLEMSRHQIADRLISSEGPIDSNVLRTGKLEGGDWEKTAKAINKLSSCNMFVNDKAGIQTFELANIASELDSTLKKKTGHGLDLLVVDYLQLMKPALKHGSREQEISEISRMLKNTAKDLNIPVVALSQLNRAVEARKDRRPMMTDIRESGSIEQDADIILFIYRDEVYDKDTKEKGVAEIIITANIPNSVICRNGSPPIMPDHPEDKSTEEKKRRELYPERLKIEREQYGITVNAAQAVKGLLEIWEQHDLLLYAKITEHWDFLLQEPLRSKIKPLYIQKGILYLTADNPAYANALLYHKHTMLSYIRVTLQNDGIRDIVCRPATKLPADNPALQNSSSQNRLKLFTAKVHRHVFIIPAVCVWLFLLPGCSGNNAKTEDAEPDGKKGSMVGMFEIQVVTWNDPMEGLHRDGITLYLRNTLTGYERQTTVKDGYYYFDNLPQGHYRIYRAVMIRENYNLELNLSEYAHVNDYYIRIMDRVRIYTGVRLRSFDDRGIGNKRERMDYARNDPYYYIREIFEGRKEEKYIILTY